MEQTTIDQRFHQAIHRIGSEARDPYNPFPLYERMRKDSPAHYDEGADAWSFFLYEDAQHILNSKELFSSSYLTNQADSKTMSSINPPRHVQIRSIVSEGFTPEVMSRWESRIQQIAGDLIDRISEQAEFDLVQDFSHPLPIRVISEMMGISDRYADKFSELSDTLIHLPKGDKANNSELTQLLEEIIQEKRSNPGDDIISLLVQGKGQDLELTAADIIPFCRMLLVAGNETTTHLISNAVYSILEVPELSARLRQNESLIPTSIEETLRFRAPAPVIKRVVQEDTTVKGQSLKKGQLVLAYLASANRDEQQFEHADRFDVDRKSNPHLAFGGGSHFCLGAPLARLETEIAVRELLSRFTSLSIPDTYTVDAVENYAVYGLRSLPLRVH